MAAVDPAQKKSNLKQSLQGIEYNKRIQEASASSQAKTQRSTRQATSINGDDRPRTKEELKQLFAWWNKEMEVDTTQPPKDDQTLLKMALQP